MACSLVGLIFSLPPSFCLFSLSFYSPFHLFSQSLSACPLSVSCFLYLSLWLRLIHDFHWKHTCISTTCVCIISFFQFKKVEATCCNLHLWSKHTQPSPQKLVTDIFLKVAEQRWEAREDECASALIQDRAADFRLARRILGGWKIIWSWLWEVVGSGRRVGERVCGLTGWWEGRVLTVSLWWKHAWHFIPFQLMWCGLQDVNPLTASWCSVSTVAQHAVLAATSCFTAARR